MLRTGTWISLMLVVLAGCEGESPKSSGKEAPPASASPAAATKPAASAAPAPASAAKPSVAPADAPAAPKPAAAAPVASSPDGSDLPQPDLSKLPMPMQMRIGSARRTALASPGDATKLVEYASLLYAQSFFAEAAEVFRRSTALLPDDFATWYMVGRSLNNAGDLAGAAEMYEKALVVQNAWFDANPKQERIPYLPILIRLAGATFESNAKRAGEALQKAIEVDPNDPAAYGGLGTLARKAGKNDEALSHFKRAIELSPRYGYAHQGLADVFEAKGDKDQAALHREQTSGKEPYVPTADPIELVTLKRGMQIDVLLMEANDYLRRRDYVQAEQAIQAAVDADASGVRGRTMLGLLRGLQQKHDDAVREYRAVTRLDPNNVPARMALADSLARTGKVDEAEQLLREIVTGDPKASSAVDQLARMLAGNKRAADAAILVNQIADKNGDDARVLTSLAETMGRIERQAEGKALAEKAVKLAPNLPEARNVLGFLLARTGDEAGAVREWREALRIAPHYAAPRVQLVQVLYAKKDRESMLKELRAGVEANPYSIDMLNSLAWLLATSPKDEQRSAAEAILFAERADMLTNSANHAVLDTLAAAYAEAGRFEDAQTRIMAAIALARDAGMTRESQDYGKRLELYKKGQPFRDQ